MKNKITVLLTLALACGGARLPAQNAAPAPVPVAAGVSADYILQPSDVIVVQVFQEDNLRREARVTQENTITLPLIEKVTVGGLSVRQAEELITELYKKDYLVNPQVTILVVSYSQRTVSVIGCVNSPGPVLFPQEKGLTLMEAIARAGGLNRLGDKKNVRITRIGNDGKTEVFVVNIEKIMRGTAQDNMQLQLNDIVYVPEIFL
ncbi:MAG: polysaccharide export protein [Opitutaceae bacterium]|jgi:polysaccharide export outer membrane protein|nr:polysaccharide export protein [Opitutaceae bacterium]